MPCGLTTLVELEVGVREEEEGGGGEGDRGASPEPDSPPGLGKFDAWLSMAAAFMSVIVAMAARGPVLLLARLTRPKFLAWSFPAWAAQSNRDLVWFVMLSTEGL